MIAALKVALPLNLDGCVAIVVGADGGKSPPTIIDKSRFINTMIETIRRTLFGFETAGLSSKEVFFTLPVELFILARHMIGADNGAYSVLEVVAQNSGINLNQIGPEYPAPERTKIAFDQVNHLLLSANRRVGLLEDKLMRTQIEAADEHGKWLDTARGILKMGLEGAARADIDEMHSGELRLQLQERWPQPSPRRGQ